MSTLTPEAYEALPDAEKNAAVARARGWRCERRHWPSDGTTHETWYSPQGTTMDIQPPPYVTAGDSDPFAGWQWLAKMVKALHSRGPVSAEFSTFFRIVAGSVERIREGKCSNQSSPHRAAGAAMAAAGLLTEEPSDGTP